MGAKINAGHINKMIRRCAETGDVPERVLWRDVICTAVADADNTGIARSYRVSARAFFDSPGFDKVCAAAGIDAEFCRGLIAKLGRPIEVGSELFEEGAVQ